MDEGWNPPIAKLIGFRLTRAGKGTATVEMEAGPQHANPMGTLHGGVICDIADAAMGIAYVTTLEAGESFTTMELKVNFLRPVWTGPLFARAKLIKKGRTTGLVACRVLDGKGRLAAFATGTCVTIAAGPGTGLARVRRESARQ
ncbi:MAG: PaaI family thioesterase [Nitrososphaerota archaeon]|nr:PaaI family thioesterase [Nitrososphaerota archaeon]